MIASSPLQVSGMADPESPSLSPHPVSDPGPANRKFYPALDGLRGLAFLMVFAQHYLGMAWGWTGVDIFFVLSGFLITGILFDTKDDPHRVWNFYIRRTLRIFPLYYGVFLLVLLLYPIFRWQWDARWLIWPAYLGNFARFRYAAPDTPYQLLADAQLLSQNLLPGVRLYLGHFWSLCVEEQFYLFWPWIVFFVKDRRRLMYLCLASVLLSPCLRVFASHHLPPTAVRLAFLNCITFWRTDALLLGGLIALILRGGHSKILLKTARITFALCVALFLLWLAVHPAMRTLRIDVYPFRTFTWGLSFIDIFAASAIVMTLHPTTWAYRAFMPKPLRWIGRISYGAYVFHDIPHDFYRVLCERMHIASPLALVVLALTCTLFLAWLSFRYFESPFIRLKEKLSRERATAPEASPRDMHQNQSAA